MTPINEVLNQNTDGSSSYAYTVPADWGQGRATFGGLLGGLMYIAIRQKIQDERPLYSFMVSFVGPVISDEPFTIDVQVLRTGKSALQAEAKIIQNGAIVTAALACFGTARGSQVNVTADPAPTPATPDTLPALPYIPNVVPAFTQHIDFRWAFGGIPFSGTQAREMGGWMKCTDLIDSDQMTVAHLITMIDAWPPAVLPLLKQVAPTSSVTWSIAFAQPLPELNTDWLLYKADIIQAAQGYGQTCAHIWNQSGQLLAISNQTVAVFD